MNRTKPRLLSLLAASSLASFASACGGSEPQPETEGQVAEADTSGGEAEQACGGGACGAVSTQEPLAEPNQARDAL